MSDVILQATGLHKSYQLGKVSLKVLKGVSLTLQRGEFVAIMGASGSGKSTLLHLLGALDIPDAGTVRFEGRDIFAGGSRARDRLRNATFGFVFQFYHLLPELTVLENTLLPCMVGNSVWSWFSRRHALRRQATEMLERMGLKERLRHRPNELSGGERQRVAIARALANRPRVLLADEPTGNLDAATGREILSVLKSLNEEGQTIVMVTHDPLVAASAHRIVSLVDGRIAARQEAPKAP
ncbi:MAG TPA: ABC transporter ATP-binding protein [Phycisphaerae bacterium]|jgi:lipoprotein-releasing system ATP-binding protein|nr:ABC transporter ATP-binding protein [Phycisphaerae bacterium]HOB75354.1 ABC transporter ATP-binding protein [Phycisphaerae bacterium]HOJ55516.1 ABC transporter ATP-binding protein [Phycisphaerae bacterium]HOL26026.1 ABC transporter ATP-binding protein [Phycisphaerae bacterium]HPP22546.1 ABC transporter ATP-binding protein [Phycisphaerae bacterium]